MMPLRTHRLYVVLNLALGILHFVFGIVEPSFQKLAAFSEGLFFLVIAALFFGTAFGFLQRNRWMVIVTAVPLVLIGGTFAFLIAGGGWIWGPSRAAQMYLFIVASILIVAFEIAGIIHIVRYTTTSPRTSAPHS